MSPEIRLELPTGEVRDGTLRIRAGAYSRFLGANVDTRGQADTSSIYVSRLEQRQDCLRATSFRPHEIKTLRIGSTLSEVNLLECSG